MAINTQIINLDVYRDGKAPFNRTTGKCNYSPPISRSFATAGLKNGISNVIEGGVTYGRFMYYPTDGTPLPEEVLTIQASGTIVTAAQL